MFSLVSVSQSFCLFTRESPCDHHLGLGMFKVVHLGSPQPLTWLLSPHHTGTPLTQASTPFPHHTGNPSPTPGMLKLVQLELTNRDYSLVGNNILLLASKAFLKDSKNVSTGKDFHLSNSPKYELTLILGLIVVFQRLGSPCLNNTGQR